MKILITNDDGVQAPGIATLARCVATWVEADPRNRQAIVVAPDRNYSGMSAAVGDVFDMEGVKYERFTIEGAESLPTYGLDAAPALCTILGVVGTFDFVPDFVLSGINAGANVGRSILHSGTVGAVFTGAQFGLSGLAVSVQWGDDVHYDTAGAVAVEVLEQLAAAPRGTLLNLNVPNLPGAELKGVRRGRVSHAAVVHDALDASGGTLGERGVLKLNLGSASPSLGDTSDEAEDDDGALIHAGYAVVTPLRGPHEDSNPGLDDTVNAALSVISKHLKERY
ncbi:MAG: 5'/3'-nucleotidase SurE [Actinomycetota bacterium]|jgi:5'-nucleotidase